MAGIGRSGFGRMMWLALAATALSWLGVSAATDAAGRVVRSGAYSAASL
jgi:hypothetical protein